VIEELRGAADEILVTPRERVERAGIDDSEHWGFGADALRIDAAFRQE
jgi:hypothetical protein